ncbi:pimeloyl-ACP methyl ester carboxylesterase [Kibdelosporangium banguiense]|uniref:Pimeloyl-ACP methyl ester carboxylesterase n=1 Tax=Kibdelosporangium banguiense TaxID=1365924 RepID=A0ABS4U2G8_9PSEU|nr:alpha/beta hydrolase [Kibdelosporangium banguiense]MBP2330840.1 pimeloyl-ACP methyl ester carboxylesterase [Kibdelosporangium banguiense]
MGTLSRRGIVLLAAVASITTACTAAPSNRPAIVVNDGPLQQVEPPVSSGTKLPLPPLEDPARSTVAWNECEPVVKNRLATYNVPEQPNTQCTKVMSVLDSPSLPGRGRLFLSLLKVGTGKIPLLVVSDIQGEPGTVRAARLASMLPADFLARFSVIGVDRRGSAGSEPVRCIQDDIRTEIVNSDPAAEDLEDLLDAVRKAGQQCITGLENRLYAMDTWRTAADLEKIREGLGVPRLNAIGVGEGSRVLGVYGDRFPDRVGRMVFDGLPDPSGDSLVTMEGVATGAEATFAEFAKDCVARGCPLGPDPKQAFLDTLAGLRSRPASAGESVLTSGSAARATLVGLANRAAWPALADAIAKARAGDGNALRFYIQPIIADSRDQPAMLDVGLVTGCNDTKTRLALERLNTTAKDWRSRYPLFGGVMAQNLVLCSAWSVAAQPPLALSGRNLPPIVVLSTASDPVTPQPGTERTAQQLPSSVLISWQGAGHGALGSSPCATDAVRAFFIEGKIPAAGTACPP